MERQQEDCESGFEVDGFEVLEGADGELEGSGVSEVVCEFRKDFGEELRVFEELECCSAGGVCEHAAEFLEDTFDADAVNLGGLFLSGVQCFRVELEVEGSSEADGAEHAESIFVEAVQGVADGADGVLFQVGLPSDEIEDGLVEGVEEHAVDGEVTSPSIFFGGAESNRIGVSAVEILPIAAEGGDFDLSVSFGGSGDRNDAEGGPNGNGSSFAEGANDIIRESISGDVVVFGFFAEELVADAASGPEGKEACVSELSDDVEGEFAAGIGLGREFGGHSRDFGTVQAMISGTT